MAHRSEERWLLRGSLANGNKLGIGQKEKLPIHNLSKWSVGRWLASPALSSLRWIESAFGILTCTRPVLVEDAGHWKRGSCCCRWWLETGCCSMLAETCTYDVIRKFCNVGTLSAPPDPDATTFGSSTSPKSPCTSPIADLVCCSSSCSLGCEYRFTCVQKVKMRQSHQTYQAHFLPKLFCSQSRAFLIAALGGPVPVRPGNAHGSEMAVGVHVGQCS